MRVLLLVERALYVLLFVPVSLLWMILLSLSVLIGIILLPVAGLKFIFTGSAGIEWWIDEGPASWIIDSQPMFCWGKKINSR